MNTSKPSRNRTIFAAILLVFGVVVTVWLTQRVDPVRKVDREHETAPLTVSAKLETPTSVEKSTESVSNQLLPKTTRLIKEELTEIDAQLSPIRQVLRDIDAANAVTELDKQQDKSRITALRVKPPDAAQLSPLYDALTKAGRSFPRDSPAAKEFRKRANSLLRGLDAKPRLVLKSTDLETGNSRFVKSVGGQFTEGTDGAISITGDFVNFSSEPPERYLHLFPKP